MSVHSGQHVAVGGLNLIDYSFEPFWLTVDQITDPPHPLGDPYATLRTSFLQSCLVHQLDYARGMMTATFSSIVNRERVTLSEMFETSAVHQVLKKDFKMVIFNGRYAVKLF